ncbi:uncharacterized protein [Physcomitrium patens]|uniref:uncharacterized protein n=1 Tax=Physcomitrium patens TaxID=3218 RepID=UPI003CCE4855
MDGCGNTGENRQLPHNLPPADFWNSRPTAASVEPHMKGTTYATQNATTKRASPVDLAPPPTLEVIRRRVPVGSGRPRNRPVTCDVPEHGSHRGLRRQRRQRRRGGGRRGRPEMRGSRKPGWRSAPPVVRSSLEQATSRPRALGGSVEATPLRVSNSWNWRQECIRARGELQCVATGALRTLGTSYEMEVAGSSPASMFSPRAVFRKVNNTQPIICRQHARLKLCPVNWDCLELCHSNQHQ